jgi:hypothetical protein
MTLNTKEVTLYQSGVGFFKADCKEQEFVLPVKEDDINDVLKSLSVNGLQSVRFSSAEDKNRIMNKIGLNISSEEALLSICRHLIGLKVDVLTNKTYTGIVMGVDEIHEHVRETNRLTTKEVLVLKNKDEISFFALDEIKEIAMQNLTLQKDLKAYLDYSANARKAGVINLQILAQKNTWATWVMPVSSWKLSYRIFYDTEKKLLTLFGISVIDNTTSIDWENVVLRLVTGKPVSFRYDLFTPLFIQRPQIARDVQGVAPIVSETGAAFDDFTEEEAEEQLMALEGAPPPPPSAKQKAYGIMKQDRKRRMEIAPMASVAPPPKPKTTIKPKVEAEIEEIGSSVAYVVNYPVTISRSQSALIPIFSEELEGDMCVILRDDRIEEAMDALYLKKSITAEKGAATVYLDETYAGDSMVIQGTEFVSFRLNPDLSSMREIDFQSKIESVSIEEAYVQVLTSEEKKYTFKFINRSKDKMHLVLEITKVGDYEPLDNPLAETKNYYRYEFTLEPGNTIKKLVFRSEQTAYLLIRDLSDYQLEEYQTKKLLTKEERQKINDIRSLFKERQEKMRALSRTEDKILQEFTNQERIRKNIVVIKDDTSLKNEYLEKLTKSEEILESLNKQKNKLKTEIEELTQQVKGY